MVLMLDRKPTQKGQPTFWALLKLLTLNTVLGQFLSAIEYEVRQSEIGKKLKLSPPQLGDRFYPIFQDRFGQWLLILLELKFLVGRFFFPACKIILISNKNEIQFTIIISSSFSWSDWIWNIFAFNPSMVSWSNNSFSSLPRFSSFFWIPSVRLYRFLRNHKE